jgi:hypothetical protein
VVVELETEVVVSLVPAGLHAVKPTANKIVAKKAIVTLYILKLPDE